MENNIKELITKTLVWLDQKKLFSKNQQQKIKEIFFKTKEFLSVKEHQSYLILGIGLFAIGYGIYTGIALFQQRKISKNNESTLMTISTYHNLQTTPATNKLFEKQETIDKLLSYKAEIQEEENRYKAYIDNLQIPYNGILKNTLFPSLNIWKDHFTKSISTDLIGQHFLKNNPYDELALLEKRQNFFTSDRNNNTANEINDLQIGEITENTDGTVYIPISFSFASTSKSSLLTLIEKLSITSDKENLLLIGEFVHNIRKKIKEQKKEEIKEIIKENKLDTNSEDENIAYELYQRIHNEKDTSLIDQGIINTTIKELGECKEIDEGCFFTFRDKYRDIPSMAYTIGIKSNTNKANDLKMFFRNLPPVIQLKKFSFYKVTGKTLVEQKEEKYQGSASIAMYGRNITPEEIEEIAKTLGKKCFLNEDSIISPEKAEETITNYENIQQENSENNEKENTNQLHEIIQKIGEEYPKLINYKKAIRLFEIYRTLNEAGLCKIL